jgi:hypothetical protein
MPVAIIGAGIAAAGSIGAAVIGSGAQKSAAKTAAQTAKDTTAANNQLQRDIYNSNYNVLSPYVNSGYQANHAINELLGLPSNDNRANSMGGAPTSALGQYGGQQNGAYGTPGYGSFITNGGVGANGGVPNTGDQIAPLNTQAPQGGAPTGGAQSAFQNYLNSTGYQFRLGEGSKALNTNWAARGLLNSGAAAKAALKYGQDYASNEFGNYMGYLSGQQNVGLSAGGALAGVGTGYANSVSANNNALASVQANSALAQGQSTANLYGTAAGALGQIGGALISSYGSPSGGIPRNTYGIVGGDGSGIY